MIGFSQSKSAPSQSVDSCPNAYREQRENLQLTEHDWRRILREGGINAVLKKKEEIDDQWKKQPVLIAVIGETGSGKSTLIRRFLGLSPDSPGDPKIGSSVKECTTQAKEYPKLGTGLVYIDLPGVGSTTATCAFRTPKEQENYCQRFRLQTVDYFLLVSQNKFTDQEKLLAEYITQKLNKSFVFVQTKMDELRREFGNKLLERKKGFQAVKDTVRTDIQNMLGCKDPKRIFLVSNDIYEIEHDGQQRWVYDNSPDYEFDILVQTIQNDMLGEDGLTDESTGGQTRRPIGGVNANKAKAFILATDAICESAIRAKAKVLRNQAWGWSMLSGALGLAPVPGVSLVCDAAIIIANAVNYFTAFGLNPARFMGEGTAIKKMQTLVSIMGASMGSRVLAPLLLAIGSSAVEEGVKVVPLVGSIVGATLSFASTCTILRQIIDFCEIEALKIIRQSRRQP